MKGTPSKKRLIVLCLLCAALLTGCYQDRDPWPASGDSSQTAATPVPEVTPITELAPTPTPAPLSTSEPQGVPLTEPPNLNAVPAYNG